jgi:sterol desaturase/sphingolipid hydroxylase (fatty acid hydroxylase superfamily)
MAEGVMLPLSIKPETLRLAAFVSVFAVMALAEKIWPRRRLLVSKAERWRVNLAIVLLNTMLLRLVFPMVPFVMAALAQVNGWGLLNLLKMTGVHEIVTSLLLLDLIIYFQHRMFHKLSFFWRIHRMHHTDIDLDVSSGTRFHPLEMIVSIVIKLAAVYLIGSSPLSVLLFEIVLNASSMFNHANVRIPEKIDGWLRLILVTPDTHRVHHSVLPLETDSNFGFNLPWWDHLFGSYRSQPRDGHKQMLIGLKEYRSLSELGLKQLLLIPFAKVNIRRTS